MLDRVDEQRSKRASTLLPLVAGVGGAAFALASSTIAWLDRRIDVADHRDQILATIPAPSEANGYRSSNGCRACHPGEYASWHRTYHRTMTQEASPTSVVGAFDGRTVRFEGGSVTPFREGDAFWMTVRAAGADESKPAASQRVRMLTGSHSFQTYWFSAAIPGDRSLDIAPLTYLIADRRWVPRADVFLQPPIADGTPPADQEWTSICMPCHSTAGDRGLKSDASGHLLQDSTVAELGIACEACHGPGEAHVRANQNPLRRFQRHALGRDETIVNPARLSSHESSGLCGQCHANRILIPSAAPLPRSAGAPWTPWVRDPQRPIISVRETPRPPDIDVALKADPSVVSGYYYSDGVIRAGGRELSGLIDSKCYQRGALSCLSCHSMHKSDPDDLLSGDLDEACLKCHEPLRDNPAAHTHHAPSSSGARCVSCHMPYTTYGLLKAVRSHFIGSPRAESHATNDRPNACNLCHLDRTLAWTSEQLQRWYGQPPSALTEDDARYPATVLALVTGDAGQRAIAAYACGLPDAVAASGATWIAPFLAPLLDDPYSAVRYVAQRSLRALPGFADFDYDYLAAPDQRRAAVARALAKWRAGGVDEARFPAGPKRMYGLLDKLAAKRDDTPVTLPE